MPQQDEVISLLTEIRDLLKPAPPSAEPAGLTSVVRQVADELLAAAAALEESAGRLKNLQGQGVAASKAHQAAQRARRAAEGLVHA